MTLIPNQIRSLGDYEDALEVLRLHQEGRRRLNVDALRRLKAAIEHFECETDISEQDIRAL